MTYRELEDSREAFTAAEQAAYEAEYSEYLDDLEQGWDGENADDYPEDDANWDDGQPDEYTEWQDYMGGDDWDHGQYDDPGDYF